MAVVIPRGEVGDRCRSRGISQNFTTVDSPHFNVVAERALDLIETAAIADRIKAQELFPGAQLSATASLLGCPATSSLLGEASHWAYGAVNRTATAANPESTSSHEMWHDSYPPVLPFLKPG